MSDLPKNTWPSGSNWIDLRSDTVTKPSAAMRAAMASAEVGDDVYGEDPTVNHLEQLAADLFSKEAALFVPTGTMGNIIAIKMHTRHGEEVACDSRSHIIDWELSMMAWFAGCIPRAIPTTDGLLTWKSIAPVLRPKGPHNAPTTLISLENTHNMAGGTVYDAAAIDEIGIEAHRRGLKLHIDGARIFNASAATGLPVSRIAREADSVMFCLSKALGAPVGSVLVGSADDLAQGRLLRKRLGGGMRQAGVLAAAGLLALEGAPAKLNADHQNAQLLARRLAACPGIRLDASTVRTNIVIFDVSGTGMTSAEFSALLKQHGILANGVDAQRVRMVTHRDVSQSDCESALQIVEKITVEKRHALTSAV